MVASLALMIFSTQSIQAQCSANQAKAVQTHYNGGEKDVVDIKGTNGIIHVIDSVVLPK